jgi:hypothetical protein
MSLFSTLFERRAIIASVSFTLIGATFIPFNLDITRQLSYPLQFSHQIVGRRLMYPSIHRIQARSYLKIRLKDSFLPLITLKST